MAQDYADTPKNGDLESWKRDADTPFRNWNGEIEAAVEGLIADLRSLAESFRALDRRLQKFGEDMAAEHRKTRALARALNPHLDHPATPPETFTADHETRRGRLEENG